MAKTHELSLQRRCMAQSAPSTKSAKKNAPLIGYVTPHVHWDRAWYLPFQQYRYRLIEFVDDLLELLENPENNYQLSNYPHPVSTPNYPHPVSNYPLAIPPIHIHCP